MTEKDDGLWEIYRVLAADIDRYRDWPIKVLTFTSALHFAVITAIAVKEVTLGTPLRWSITALFVMLFGFTFYYFKKCHLFYLESRKTQARLNRVLYLDQWKVSDAQVFPAEWFDDKRTVALRTGLWGWGFYVWYAFVLLLILLAVVWQIGFAWKQV